LPADIIPRSPDLIRVAAQVTLATAAIGGTSETSEANAERAARVRHLDDHRIDHRQVGRDR
jgi:hypothetical protein